VPGGLFEEYLEFVLAIRVFVFSMLDVWLAFIFGSNLSDFFGSIFAKMEVVDVPSLLESIAICV